MKKQLLAAVFLAAATGAAAAADTDTVRVSLQLIKNDKAVWSFGTSALKGQRTPIVSIDRRVYAASCHIDEKGVAVITPETLTTGMEAYVTAVDASEGGTVISVAFSHKELTGMKTVTSKGCTVEEPSTRIHEATAQVVLKVGEEVELPSFNGVDKYVMVLRTL